MVKRLLALVLCAALPLPALAQTHVIAELGSAPLIGQVSSTAQLQSDVRDQSALFAAAGSDLGLSPREYAAFAQRIAGGRLAYVTIPRHLDAMSWRSGTRVRVLHDVIIPANTKGWEIDLSEPGEIVALFIPNKCGNLSLVRRPVPLVASVMPVEKPLAPAVVEAAQFAPTPAPAPVATPLPYANLALAQPPSPSHRTNAWPLLLLVPLIAMFASHGHSSPVGFSPLTPAAPAAPAPVAGCPTPAPH